MSYFNKAIVLYPNLLNYNSADREASLNYDPEAEPSVTVETYLSSGGETSGAVYDLVDDKLSSTLRIDTGTGTTNPTIQVDLTTQITIDTIILANHNLKTADAKIGPQTGGAAPITVNASYSGAQQITGEWRGAADTVAGNVVTFVADGVSLLELDNSSQAAYVLDINDVDGNYDANITIGEIVLSKKWTSPHAPEVSGWQDTSTFGGVVNKTKGGQKYGVFYHGERKEWVLPWMHLTQSQFDDLRQVFRVTKGDLHPFWIDLGEHATLPYLHFVRFVNRSLVANPIAGGTRWNVTFNVIEEV